MGATAHVWRIPAGSTPTRLPDGDVSPGALRIDKISVHLLDFLSLLHGEHIPEDLLHHWMGGAEYDGDLYLLRTPTLEDLCAGLPYLRTWMLESLRPEMFRGVFAYHGATDPGEGFQMELDQTVEALDDYRHLLIEAIDAGDWVAIRHG